MENKGESEHFLEILENLEIVEILEIPRVKMTPFILTPFVRSQTYLLETINLCNGYVSVTLFANSFQISYISFTLHKLLDASFHHAILLLGLGLLYIDCLSIICNLFTYPLLHKLCST